MSACQHVWIEGGTRDHGRYHCQLCQHCMNPLSEIRTRDEQITRLQEELAALRTSEKRLREALGWWHIKYGCGRWDKDCTCGIAGVFDAALASVAGKETESAPDAGFPNV